MTGTMLTLVTYPPKWIWLVLVYLLFIGLRRLRPRVARPVRLAVAPIIFTVWGLIGITSKNLPVPLTVACWAFGAVVAAGCGAYVSPVRATRRDRQRGWLFLPGTVATLVVGLGEFILRYGLGVAAVIQPSWREQLAWGEVIVAGAGAGYFIGWVTRLCVAYPDLPDVHSTD